MRLLFLCYLWMLLCRDLGHRGSLRLWEWRGCWFFWDWRSFRLLGHRSRNFVGQPLMSCLSSWRCDCRRHINSGIIGKRVRRRCISRSWIHVMSCLFSWRCNSWRCIYRRRIQRLCVCRCCIRRNSPFGRRCDRWRCICRWCVRRRCSCRSWLVRCMGTGSF